MGCAKDIVELCGVPRFLFSDFPLGNSAGRPFDVESQRQTLELALQLLERAPGARTTMQSPLRWSEDASWKRDYLDLASLSPEKLAERRKEFDEVKIESHEGDDTRNQLADRVWAERKMAPSFLAVNGNKRSITLDLRMPAAVEVVKKLAATADVVWENFRGGVMDRLGLGYAALSAVNPRLIYCAVSGFGQTGPERTTAAFDGKLQAMSGIMSITGEPAHGPTRAGFAICDTIGGMTAALAVASALYQRTHTGRGQLVDVAMLDAALAFIP